MMQGTKILCFNLQLILFLNFNLVVNVDSFRDLIRCFPY